MDTYLNIGSIENFREYYTTYAEVAIGEYEHWEEEEWVDAANPDWQKFIGQLSQELNEKGVDGFFINKNKNSEFPIKPVRKQPFYH